MSHQDSLIPEKVALVTPLLQANMAQGAIILLQVQPLLLLNFGKLKSAMCFHILDVTCRGLGVGCF